MTKFGYIHVSVDHCIYIRTTKDGTSIVAIHMDDMLACASSEKEMQKLKGDLESVFEIKDLGDVHWLLGVSITRNRKARTISLSQGSYIDTVVARFKMRDAYPVHTPLEPGVHLSKSMSPSNMKEKERIKDKPYQVAVGSLMYAASQPVQTLVSQYNS
jgi:hypothetical protein